MMRVGLTTYGINVRDINDLQYELHDVYGKGFLDIIEKGAKNDLKVYDNNRNNESVFTVDDIKRKLIENENGQARYEVLFLRVKTGDYGVESEIVDSGSGITSYTRSATEADVLPFGCCIMVPCGEFKSGVVTIQSIGRYGIKSVMNKRIDAYVKAINSNLRITMGTIVPKVYMERFLEHGVLQSIRIIRHGIPNDVADQYGVDRNVKNIVEERVIRKPSGFLSNKLSDIKACMNGTKRYDEVVQIEGFEVDDLKLDFKMGKRNKSISLKNLENLVAAEDITDEVAIEKGNPNFSSLCEIMQTTAEFYLRAKDLLY